MGMSDAIDILWALAAMGLGFYMVAAMLRPERF